MEKIFDIQITLRYLRVPLKKKNYMLGYNKSIVDSSMTPYSKTCKRHVDLLFHRVEKTIATCVASYYFIQGYLSLASVLNKC